MNPSDPSSGDPLPDAARALIAETLRLAALSPDDEAAVNSDLRAHFHDGLASGRTVNELIEAFGDPALAARLIAESRRPKGGSEPAGRHGPTRKESWMIRFADGLKSDARYAFRGLKKTPGFTIIAALTIALGIGVNTAIFSVVRATLLSSLPIENSHLLVRPYFRHPAKGFDRSNVPYAEFVDWRDQSDVFDAVANYTFWGRDLEGEPPVRAFGARVSQDFFKVYRAEPVIGRWFLEEEYVEGAGKVIVLARSYWQSRFGATPDILGSTVRLGGEVFTVAGVVDETATWPTYPQFWAPRIFPATATVNMQRRDNFNIQVVARLREGVSIEQASTRISEIARRVAADEPALREGWDANAIPLGQWIVGTQLPTTLLVLLGAATFVLLIACSNVASLLATRTAARKRQMAIRVAMGAGPWQVGRHLLAESLLLFVLGGSVGLLLASLGVDALLALAPANVPRINGAEIRLAELVFGLALAAVAGLGFGLYPALQARKADPNLALREGTGSAGSRSTSRFRQMLVVAEVALSVVLLVGAGLMIRSLGAMNSNDPGFRLDHLLTMGLSPPAGRYPNPSDVDEMYRQMTERFEALPGVQLASTTTWMPIGGGGIGLGRAHLAVGMPEPPAGPEYMARWVVVDPELLQTLEWPLRRGRSFSVADDSAGVQVAIINEMMAEQMFLGEDALGKLVRSWRDENVYREIVGVVGNLRLDAVTDELEPLFLVPARQIGWARFRNVVLRTSVDPATLIPRLQEVVSQVDPLLPALNPRTGETIFGASVAASRFTTLLLGVFAGLAAIVAAIGLYGVISSAVTNRTKELGIRTALGAGRGRTVALVMKQGLRLAVVGAAVGTAGAMALTGVMSSLLFQVGARDPVTFIGVPAGLLLVALLASYLPARRATRVDPVGALRGE